MCWQGKAVEVVSLPPPHAPCPPPLPQPRISYCASDSLPTPSGAATEESGSGPSATAPASSLAGTLGRRMTLPVQFSVLPCLAVAGMRFRDMFLPTREGVRLAYPDTNINKVGRGGACPSAMGCDGASACDCVFVHFCVCLHMSTARLPTRPPTHPPAHPRSP